MATGVAFPAVTTGAGLNNPRATLHLAAIAAMEDLDMSKHEEPMDGKELAHRHGGFGDYVVDGKLCEYSDGRRIWWIIVGSPILGRPDVDQVDLAFRVSGDDIRCAPVGITIPELKVVSGEPLTDIDPAVKEAVVGAIQKWESDEAGGTRPGLEA